MEQEKKPNEQIEMEKHAEALERKIARFTNIDTENFTHSFRGISITVNAGETYLGRLPECDHLAKHLARKMLTREKKKVTKKDRGVQLWKQKEVDELKQKMIVVVDEQGANTQTAEEAHKEDQKVLHEKYDNQEEQKNNVVDDINKKDIIEDLEKRGIEVDPNLSKDELLTKLMESEQAGITQDNPQT